MGEIKRLSELFKKKLVIEVWRSLIQVIFTRI